MEFDELLITTGVDALVRLVKEKERIELEDASSILNIPQETVEDWARVLEEEGILRMEYRLTRIYLRWVTPTEEEVARETESFYEEKKGLQEEVKQVREKAITGASEVQDLRNSFDQFYSRVHGRIDKLEKMVAPVPAAKTISEDILAKSKQELGTIETELRDVKDALIEIKDEMRDVKVKKSTQSSKKLMDKLEKMSLELGSLQNDLGTLQKKASREVPSDVDMPSVKDIKTKFVGLKKDFTGLRSQNARMREDMVSLHESSEILKEVAESIMGQEDKIGTLRKEMAELSRDAERLDKKSKAIIAKVKDNAELAERLSDSVDVSKNILKKFPSQKKVMDNIERLESAEKELEEKTVALEKLLEAVGGRRVTAKKFEEVAKKMETKSRQMRREMDALETALDDEKSTYLTFQRIKERVIPSVERYQKQLDSMESRMKKVKTESTTQMRDIKNEAQKLQQSMKKGQVQDVVKLATEIREKKKTLESIKASLDDLADMSDNLNKRVTLLSREAKLLEIRTGGGIKKAPAEEEGVKKKLSLTQEEELEFRKKREELKRLIQKLWEE